MSKKSVKKEYSKLKHQKKSGEFVLNLQSEFRKIDWPNRSDVTKASFAILVFMVFFTGFVALADSMFAKMILMLKGI